MPAARKRVAAPQRVGVREQAAAATREAILKAAIKVFAKHGYAYYRVGQYTAFGGYEGARQGGVLFAGDHTSQDFQGFMEGAATEGERAARDLLDLL